MKVLVLAGGLSPERNVSLSSGDMVCQALRERGHQVALMDLFYGLDGALSGENLRREKENVKSLVSDISHQTKTPMTNLKMYTALLEENLRAEMHMESREESMEMLQEILRQTLDRQNDRRAKPMPDGIYLFEHISCPAILVECGFLSNGEEASLLLTDTYQRKIAVALAGAYVQELQMIPSVWRGE